MPTILTTAASELGTLVLTISFLDEAGAPEVPNSAKWHLTDLAGNVINARTNVAITPLASTVNIVLSGNDLKILASEKNFAMREFTVEWKYDSTYGSDLPDNASVQFKVIARNMILSPA